MSTLVTRLQTLAASKPQLVQMVWIMIATLLVSGFFFYLQFQTDALVEIDGYFHIKLSSLMRQHGPFYGEPWLRYTIFSDHYLDHHFLFHIFQMPFTFGDLIIGGKASVVFFSSLMTLAFYFFLRAQHIPFSFLWTLVLLVGSYPFLYRMNMARVQNVSLTFLIAGCLLLIEKRWKLLALLIAAYVWLYMSASVFLPIILCLYLAAEWLGAGTPPWRYVKPVLICAAAYIAATLINPHFPSNLHFIYLDIVDKVSPSFVVNVGNEWYPYDSWFLFRSSLPVFVCLGLMTGTALLRGQRPSIRSLFLMLVCLLYLLLYLKSRRFVEYFPAFAVLAAASLFGDLVQGGWRPWAGWRGWRRVAAVASVGLLLAGFGYLTIPRAIEDIRGSNPVEKYQDAALWLMANSEPGDVVLNLDWDDFPRLFFFNSENHWVVGLDPVYMHLHNAELYQKWRAIVRGEVARPSEQIMSLFGAKLIFSDDGHAAFQRQAEQDPNIRMVFQDRWAKIYRITIP